MKNTDKEFDIIFDRLIKEVFYEVKPSNEQKEYLYWLLFKEWAAEASEEELLATTESYLDYLAKLGDLE